MSPLDKYKSLVDKLRSLPIDSPESTVSQIDSDLQRAWDDLDETDKIEAEDYWRSSTLTNIRKLN